jgi:hypothetical protein
VNSLKYIRTENLNFAENRFILSKQFNEKISGHVQDDTNIKINREDLFFFRVESNDNKNHEEVINLLKNNRMLKS